MPSSAPKSPAAKRKQKGARASPAPKTPAKPWLQAPASSPSPSSAPPATAAGPGTRAERHPTTLSARARCNATTAVVITPVHSKTKPIVSPRRPPGSRGRILAKLAKEGTSGLAEASRRQRLAQMSEHKYYQVRYSYSYHYYIAAALLHTCCCYGASPPRAATLCRRTVTTTTLAH